VSRVAVSEHFPVFSDREFVNLIKIRLLCNISSKLIHLPSFDDQNLRQIPAMRVEKGVRKTRMVLFVVFLTVALFAGSQSEAAIPI